MTTIEQVPLKQGKNGIFKNHYVIEDTDIDTLIDFCMTRIRIKSQNFYKNELRTNLEKYGTSIIDRQAGWGTSYTVKLIE